MLSTKTIPGFLLPVIENYKSWIDELTRLCKGSEDAAIQYNLTQIERKHIAAIRPTLIGLALFETFDSC